ncbi:MAG: 4Fe-4S binding protein [Candidatus Krumholzibacteria bacterium]|nr:4Fe-4S binding protein [Candidatus Krumholzibacteria bacterium]
MKRKIIRIDEDLCTGCGACIPDCPEGALQLIDGKARLVSDLFCDGLGACIGTCPEGAISVEERDAEPYDEARVMMNIIPQGPNVIRAHLEHLLSHGQDDFLREALACLAENDVPVPDGFSVPLDRPPDGPRPETAPAPADRPSQLRQWPVQIMLVPTAAPFFDGADLLFAADCVPFAYAGFHEKLLRGRVCLVGCPKLDDARHYLEKITEIFRSNDIRSVMIAYMQVPCCGGLVRLVEEAIAASGKNIPLARQKISIKGEEL